MEREAEEPTLIEDAHSDRRKTSKGREVDFSTDQMPKY